MENKKAIVFGAAGQDGYYISKLLIDNEYEVFGIVKEYTKKNRLEISGVNYIKVDISKPNIINEIIEEINPHEIYNLMGVTNIFNPWDNPETIYHLNLIVPIRIIEAIKNINPKIKYLQASSCLVFGDDPTESPQTEKTNRSPIYHYGYSKNYCDDIIKIYRNKFDLFLCSAILYNHESPKRGENFFLKKIIMGAVKISKGIKNTLEVGDLNIYKDIGYAGDYMEACYILMQHKISNDYIIGSGKSVLLMDLLKMVFKKLNLTIEKHVKINDKLKRKTNTDSLIANITKIKKLGWEPKHSVENLIDNMIKYEINQYE